MLLRLLPRYHFYSVSFLSKKKLKKIVEDVHWLPMSTLLEDLRRHVPRCSTRRGESMVLFSIHG